MAFCKSLVWLSLKTSQLIFKNGDNFSCGAGFGCKNKADKYTCACFLNCCFAYFLVVWRAFNHNKTTFKIDFTHVFEAVAGCNRASGFGLPGLWWACREIRVVGCVLHNSAAQSFYVVCVSVPWRTQPSTGVEVRIPRRDDKIFNNGVARSNGV